ncbi:hypothetical protein ACIBH1_40775 [Nonomuraea sp. NPDC050663]|uniref:hypothetical protein n=1 Tax=Nonomuraea sp. NPDC050663 TaxID=3364370 RepID=UPI0037B0686B
MPDISYIEAWGLWLDGKSTLGNDLFGVPMIWWGRIGKIAAFVAGMTVVLDIIGPERLRQFGGRHVTFDAETSRWPDKAWAVACVCGTTAPLVVFVGSAIPAWSRVMPMIGAGLLGVSLLCVLLTFERLVEVAVRGLARVFEHRKSELVTRCVALLTLAAGFHFDLLAS